MLNRLLVLLFLIFLGSSSFAEELQEVTLLVDTPYILVLDADAESFSITNPNVLSIRTLDTFDNSKEQVIITGEQAGTTKLGITTSGKVYKYLIKVLSSGKVNPGDFMELDTPEGGIL